MKESLREKVVVATVIWFMKLRSCCTLRLCLWPRADWSISLETMVIKHQTLWRPWCAGEDGRSQCYAAKVIQCWINKWIQEMATWFLLNDLKLAVPFAILHNVLLIGICYMRGGVTGLLPLKVQNSHLCVPWEALCCITPIMTESFVSALPLDMQRCDS